ncbi:hypothetical protein C0J52_08054 [Blattella germanica]|nr:hypothetical protein C0J52_08054 [Blattella germanica]
MVCSNKIPLINVSDSDEGKCAGIPARHVVDILYTTVPDPGPKGHPIHRICGVRVRLDVVDWAPDINASRQIFLLESAITFTPVPIVDRNSVSRFWEAVRSPEGSENAWLNFFQVLDQFETGDEVAEMSTYVIGIMFVAVTFTIFTRQHFPL